ncbi:cupin domain-containing protein [Burkholderia sp. 22PA0099]|uniref:cupin domain-containing protein n=1 Tax=Burkholderia sp. 22PA0099 TaxID=3237372 RepID=UPI0039C003E9
MDQPTFLAQLARDGFPAPVPVKRGAGTLDEHSHPFEARALIVAGEITLHVAGVDTCYRPGDVFHLLPNIPHLETCGPDGVEYLVGRK